MQRLHVEDIAGRMLQEPSTVGLVLPMEFEPGRRYESKWGDDWRVEPGALLCPLRFPRSVIEDERVRMTSRAFAAQHQQRPAPAQGALFQREWFTQRWTQLPLGIRLIMSVDASLKEGKDSDFCVIQVWGVKGANQFYLVDQTRARMGFATTIQAIRALRSKWVNVGQILVEDKANGTAIIETLKRSLPGVVAINPEGGKMARANAIEPFLRAFNVWFPEAKWVDDLIEEAVTFPVGSFDDQVDCLSQALLWLSGRTRNTVLKRAMANARAGRTFR